MSKKKARVTTYSTDDGHTIKTRNVNPRLCWGEPTKDIEIVIDKQEDRETAVYIPSAVFIKLFREYLHRQENDNA